MYLHILLTSKWNIRLHDVRLNGSFVLMLRSLSEPGVRVRKAMY